MKERWWFGADAQKALGARLDLSVAGWMQATATGEVLSTDRDSAAVRLEVEAGSLLVKWRAVRPEQRWRWWLRASRERCEARGMLAARACGIDVPLPLAVGERRDGFGRLLGSVLVRTFVDLEPADQLLEEDGPSFILPHLAAGLRRWHDAGYRHGDCWPKNLLVSRDGEHLRPIGAPKAFMGPAGQRLDRARLADLARLEAGYRRLCSDGTPFLFLDSYVAVPPALPRETVRSGIQPLLERVMAKRAEDERTRPTREPHGPPKPVPLPADARPVRRVVQPTERV